MPEPFPISVTWREGQFTPVSHRHAVRCAKHFEEGKRYVLMEQDARSSISHQHFFASLNEAWANLPDHLAKQFPSPDILRKHALIMTGFRRERKFAASSPEEAQRIAAFLRPQESSDDYAVISVHDRVVVEWKARSQAYSKMGKADFQKSKQAVIDYISELIGVTPAELTKEAGQAA